MSLLDMLDLEETGDISSIICSNSQQQIIIHPGPPPLEQSCEQSPKTFCTQVGKLFNPVHWEGSVMVAPTSTNRRKKITAVGKRIIWQV